MDKNIFEEGPRKGHASGDTSVEQQASQLTSDIKYKARQKMKGTSGSNLSPAQVQTLYRSLLGSSTAPGAVKAIAKKKLFGEQVDRGIIPVSEHLQDSKASVISKVFEDRKYVIKVVDKATGNTSYRKADRAKIAELRANNNIRSVEITGRKEADDAYKGDPKPSGGKKAKKDYDGDGKVESGTAEYMGSRDKAIKKAMAKEEVEVEEGYGAPGHNPGSGEKSVARAKALMDKKGQKGAPGLNAMAAAKKEHEARRGVKKEEFIADAKQEDDGEKKLDVMKGKNEVKINPSLGESIKAELAALKAEKVQAQEAVMNQQADERKQEALAQQQAKKDKMMKVRILRNKMMAVRQGTEVNASHEMEGDSIIEADGCSTKSKKVEGEKDGTFNALKDMKPDAKDIDPRELPTRINLAKNKLRAMGLKMSYDMDMDMEGEYIDEVVGAVAGVARVGALAAKGAAKAAPVVAKGVVKGAKVAGKAISRGAKMANKVGKKVDRAVDTADKAADVALKMQKLKKQDQAEAKDPFADKPYDKYGRSKDPKARRRAQEKAAALRSSDRRSGRNTYGSKMGYAKKEWDE